MLLKMYAWLCWYNSWQRDSKGRVKNTATDLLPLYARLWCLQLFSAFHTAPRTTVSKCGGGEKIDNPTAFWGGDGSTSMHRTSRAALHFFSGRYHHFRHGRSQWRIIIRPLEKGSALLPRLSICFSFNAHNYTRASRERCLRTVKRAAKNPPFAWNVSHAAHYLLWPSAGPCGHREESRKEVEFSRCSKKMEQKNNNLTSQGCVRL